MNKEFFVECATDALTAMGKKNNEVYLKEGENPIQTLTSLVNDRGIVWAIDSASEVGMTHLGLSYFLTHSKQFI